MRIEVTRGVVGVANHDGLGAWCDSLLEVLDRWQGEARLDVTRDGDNLGITQLGEGVIVSVIRFWNDDLIARVQADGESHLKSLTSTSGDDDLIRGDIDPMAVIIVTEGAAIGRNTSGMAIFQNAMRCREFTSDL